MHHTFKRVVVLINDISNIEDLVQKGIDFSKQQKKKLEILFVQERATDSLLDYFFSSPSKEYTPLNKDKVEKQIQKYIDQLDNKIEREVLILEENVLKRVLAYAKECKDILFITNYDKKLSEKLLEKTPYSYWIFKNSSLTYNNILLPIELSDDAVDDIKLTQDIFPKSSIDIVHDYHYMIPHTDKDGSPMLIPVVGSIDTKSHEGTRKKQKNIFDNYKKYFHVQGDFIEEKKGLDKDLIEYIKEKDTDLVVIHHKEKLMFVPSLTFNLLHELPSNFLILNR